MPTQQGTFERIVRRLRFFEDPSFAATITAAPRGNRGWLITVERHDIGKYGELTIHGNATVWVKVGRRGVPGNPHELTSHTDAIEAADVVLDWLDGKTE